MELHSSDHMGPVSVAAFYRFIPIAEPDVIAHEIRTLGAACAIKGTIIFAHEGFNGTIAGDAASVNAVLDRLHALPDAGNFRVARHQTETVPFLRWKVKVKPEIVTMGMPDLNPATNAGTYVKPADWNALIEQGDVILIDTRNSYEFGIGSFAGAIDPQTRSFRAFPDWFDAQAEKWATEGRKPRLAMFCTGGIRCEKSTAFARARGFEDVYHLEGGILAYLDKIPKEESLWHGECFIFDERISLTHELEAAVHALCAICGQPVTDGPDTSSACPTCMSAAGKQSVAG